MLLMVCDCVVFSVCPSVYCSVLSICRFSALVSPCFVHLLAFSCFNVVLLSFPCRFGVVFNVFLFLFLRRCSPPYSFCVVLIFLLSRLCSVPVPFLSCLCLVLFCSSAVLLSFLGLFCVVLMLVTFPSRFCAPCPPSVVS